MEIEILRPEEVYDRFPWVKDVGLPARLLWQDFLASSGGRGGWAGPPCLVAINTDSGASWDKQVLGALMDSLVSVPGLDRPTCFDVVVHPAFRGRGIARCLVERFISIAGDNDLQLVNYPLSDGGRRLLQHFGFVEVGPPAHWILPRSRK